MATNLAKEVGTLVRDNTRLTKLVARMQAAAAKAAGKPVKTKIAKPVKAEAPVAKAKVVKSAKPAAKAEVAAKPAVKAKAGKAAKVLQAKPGKVVKKAAKPVAAKGKPVKAAVKGKKSSDSFLL